VVSVVVLEVVSWRVVSGGRADLPACWHSCGPDDDDNIIVVVTVFAIADSRGV
jgi:hypothetical protein